MKKIHNMSIMSITDLRCNFIVMILTRTGLHSIFHFSLTPFSAWKYDDKLLDAKEEDNFDFTNYELLTNAAFISACKWRNKNKDFFVT